MEEPYRIPERTAAAIEEAESKGRYIIAIGTTVVRALESAANLHGARVGNGVASGRIVRGTPLRVVDAILTGVHQSGESHFELLRAFADDAGLKRISTALVEHGYRAHEFGDSILLQRQIGVPWQYNSWHPPPHDLGLPVPSGKWPDTNGFVCVKTARAGRAQGTKWNRAFQSWVVR